MFLGHSQVCLLFFLCLSWYSNVLEGAGECQSSLARELAEFEMQVEQDVLAPMSTLLEVRKIFSRPCMLVEVSILFSIGTGRDTQELVLTFFLVCCMQQLLVHFKMFLYKCTCNFPQSDIPVIAQTKKKLSKTRLDMDTCKSRYDNIHVLALLFLCSVYQDLTVVWCGASKTTQQPTRIHLRL